MIIKCGFHGNCSSSKEGMLIWPWEIKKTAKVHLLSHLTKSNCMMIQRVHEDELQTQKIL